jgi:plastocyanin
MVRAKAACAAALAAAVAVASCGGGSDGSATVTSPTPPSQTLPTITVVRDAGTQSFSPNPAAVGGQTIVFRNTDAVVHRIVLNDGSVDTGDIAPGATSRAVLMPAAGTNYHCSLHPTMIGAVNPAAGGAPPPCVGLYCEDK